MIEVDTAAWDVEMKRMGSGSIAADQKRGGELVREDSDVPEPLRSHAVAFRYRSFPTWGWTPAIVGARQDYDEGKTEMCQGLFNVKGYPAWVLFSIPRRAPRKAKPYFSEDNR
jgi:hypothetical protein